MDPSLVGSQMSSDETSEQSSIHEEAGYDEVFGSGDEFESFLQSSERETSAQSSNNDVESYVKENEKEVVDEGGDEVEGGEGKNGSCQDICVSHVVEHMS